MSTLRKHLIEEAYADGFIGPCVQPRAYWHTSIISCNRILAYVSSQPDATAIQIAHHCKLTPNTAMQYANLLVKLGALKMVSEGQGGKNYYFLD